MMKIIILVMALLSLGSIPTYTYGHTNTTMKIEKNRKKIRLEKKDEMTMRTRSLHLFPINAYLCDETLDIEFIRSLQNVNIIISSDVSPTIYENWLNNISENQQLSIPINHLEPGVYQIEFNIDNSVILVGEFIIEETLLFN